MISTQLPVSIPLNTPALFSGSLKQYVSSVRPLSTTDITDTNCSAFLCGSSPLITKRWQFRPKSFNLYREADEIRILQSGLQSYSFLPPFPSGIKVLRSL